MHWFRLDQFQGFDELKKQYEATVLTPYTFQNKVYGLPITLDYHLLFIRDDIFDELGLAGAGHLDRTVRYAADFAAQ